MHLVILIFNISKPKYFNTFSRFSQAFYFCQFSAEHKVRFKEQGTLKAFYSFTSLHESNQNAIMLSLILFS